MTVEPGPILNDSPKADNATAAPGKKLRALIVSFHFPPYQTIGAIRVGKLAKFLIEQGWDIKVLSADHTAARGMPLEIPEELVVRTKWIDIDRVFSRRAVLSRLGFSTPSLNAGPGDGGRDFDAGFSGRFRRLLHRLFFTLAHWPDRQIGWAPYAVRAGDALLATWRPDVILASSPPPTTLLAADILARRHGLPWIADFRDPWVDNPYYEYPWWRYYIERAWEKAVVGRCWGIVSVSPVVRDRFDAKFHKPSILAMNGFDPSDYPDAADIPKPTGEYLRIIFTGHIYSGYSDPTILFEAVRDMGAEGRRIRMEFYGTCCETLALLARKIGVESSVIIHGAVSHQESLKIQMGADVLLSLQWINEKEMSRIAAKLFEYIGARRPILAIGYAKGPVVDLLKNHHAGFVCDNATDVVVHLRNWLTQKQNGGVPSLSDADAAGLTRAEQFARVERFMQESVAAHREASIDRH